MNRKLTTEALKKRVKANPNLGVPLYLCGAYAYYELDDPFFSDAMWEWLAKFLKEHFDTITHRHKDFLTLDMLAAGSFLLLGGRSYPSIVKGACADLQWLCAS